MKKFFTIISLMFIVGIKVFAVPAYPYPIVFQQPDGDKVTVLMKGDERIHWSESPDGYTLLYNKSGYLTYAVLDENGNLQPSEHIATDVEKRDAVVHSFLNTIGKKLFYSDAQKQLMLKVWEIEDEYATRGDRAVTGTYKTLCAFVQFPEKSFIKQMSDFEGLMNQVGYTGNGTGSVRDFFKESSYGQFDLIITLCGVYTAPKSESYYAGDDGTEYCQELARWAAQQVAAEPSINFADYDSDNNDAVDGFHFIFAGAGQEAGGGNETIWSHKWQFYPVVSKNGKDISIYSCSPELYSGAITTIGVICHEMTHAFGSPDFYDTNYNNIGDGQYDGTGQWDIMAGGSWNGSPGGNCPPHHNMYQKVQFGWVTPIVLNSATTVTNMPNSAENPVAYRINTGNGSEHYLLDNRQKISTTFDAYIPGSGLLIYHVHSSVGSYEINITHPQRLYPVCASSTTAIPGAGNPATNYGSINSAGCPFPGSSNNTSFDGASTPRMFYWNNTVISDKPITEIQNTPNQTVSFKFMGGATISNNANLASLTAVPGTLNPVFSPNTTSYTVDVANSVTAITITGTAEDANATVTGTGTNLPLNVGSNLFTVTVTAQDGTTIKNYTVTVIRAAASSNANLASLTAVPGTLNPVFSPNTTVYTVDVANSVTAITITGVAEDANATVTGNVTNAPLNVGSNLFIVTVTAQDGTTIKNYTVTVIRAASSNANLATLTVNQGTLAPAFSPNITSYTVNVAYAVTAITITGTAEDANATVTGTGTKPLNVGSNLFTITVTAQDGATKNYYINVIRAAASSNANLALLTVNPGTLNPAFSPTTTNYTVDVAYTVTTITITGIPADVNATISGDGPKPLNIGSNNFTVTVTAQDGATKNYYINVIRAAASSNANLATLIVNQGTLYPVFDPNTTVYTVDVANTVTTISIAGTAEDADATVTGNVNNAPLIVGNNNFTIKVTAQNGTIKNYTVTVIRAGSSNANLASLAVDPYILSPAFNPNITDYIVDVAKIVTTITITATVQEPNATVTGTVTNAPLIIGNNLFTLTVTAQDGTIQEYHINVIRAGNDNANLTNLVYSTGTLVPMFNPNITNYTLNVANMVTDITLVGIPEDPNATVAGNVYNYPINVGSNPFTITVTAEDGITTKDYYINVVRAFSGNGADLASLTVDPGVLVPAFSPNVTVYTVNVVNSVTVMNYITGVPDDPSATVTGNVTNAPLNVGSNLFTITVTAQDGVTTKSYYVTVIRAGSTGTNANLANLIVSTGTLTPVFNPNTTVYTLNVMHVVTDITLIGIPEDLNATVTGNVYNAPINVGSNPFVITVTSGDGTVTKDYYVNVVRADVSSNADLASLTVMPGSLAPAFSPDITDYTVNVAYLVTAITIKGTAQNAFATVTGNVTNAPLTVGSNLFIITVTAQDGVTIKEYTVTVIRATSSANANLASLTVNPGTLNPAFSPNITNYIVNVDESTAAISITGVAEDPYATVTGNVTNAPIKIGSNLFTITVTAQDGVTVKNYYVTVIRAGIPQYVITASVEDNIGGTISPKGMITIGQGESITYKMTPDDGYYIIHVLVDDVNIGTDNSYTFNNVTSDHTIVVKFDWGTAITPPSPSEGGNVRIYPNPTSGELRVESGELRVENVEIFDVFGKTCNVSHVTCNENKMDISSLPTGIYFIRIQTENGVVTRKVVKN